jgi:tRNA A-37 threonylcarbamoyl transferase component Bud32
MKQPATKMSYASTAFGATTWPRSRYQIADAFASCFPVAEFPDYEAFLNAPGEQLKREQRTLVTIIHRPRQSSSVDGSSSFVLKVYKYPFLPRIRTGFQTSKAEREFQSLRYLNEMGIGAAQAVGYGVERDSLGFVRSCFIITRLVEDSINLSQWYAKLGSLEKLDARKVDQVFTQLGRMFRRLHQARFFLFTAKSKNILLRNDMHRADGIFLIDIPYARTLKWRLLARWAQARDIGVLLGNVTASLSDRAIELFYQAYLPDPLGSPSKTVRRHALRQMRAKQNRTLISRWVNDIKRRLAGKATKLIGLLILAENHIAELT